MDATGTISFFRDVELLAIPCVGYPKEARWKWTREVDPRSEKLPADFQQDIVGHGIPYYWVHLGCPKQVDLVKTVAHAICGAKSAEDFLEERIGGQRGALATLTLDWAGRLIKGSLRVAPFVVACPRLAKNQDLATAWDEVEKLEKTIEDWLGAGFENRLPELTEWELRVKQTEDQVAAAIEAGDHEKFGRLDGLLESLKSQEIIASADLVSLDKLRNTTRRLADKIGIQRNLPILVREAGRLWKEEKRFPSPPRAEDFASFHFRELTRIITQMRAAKTTASVLESFLDHGRSIVSREEVVRCDEEISQRLAAETFVPARWPTKPEHSLSLAQQIGVQDALDTTTLITAVNGPPGTGKTTLLRDVMANQVVRRAQRLAALGGPEEAFDDLGEMVLVAEGIVEGTEVVVASNGNRAVENITLEIPKRTEIDNETFHDADHLAEAAEAVAIAFEKPAEAWGLIALVMGKKSNVSRTMEALRYGARTKDRKLFKKGLIGTLEEAGPPAIGEWKNAVAEFEGDLARFEQEMCVRMSHQMPTGSSLSEIIAIQGDAERHTSSAWVNLDLEVLRGRIFINALKLHEISLRSVADGINGFLVTFEAVLTGEEEVSPERFLRMWRSFFMISPVISTTFASMRRLPCAEGWIGSLMVDEAGQATPQSVISGLYRASKAVIVGDPAQLQPIFTVPDPVIEALRERRQIPKELSPARESAQSIADATMRVGGYLPDPLAPDKMRWAGIPLRVHRRCALPMFSIINTISYEGQMVSQGDLKAAARALQVPFETSQWFDVRGVEHSKQTVKLEMECLEGILTQFRDANILGPGLPTSAMVITPFAKVKGAAWGVISRVFGRDYRGIEAGTIHSFQGRESDVVFLVLGSAPGKKGAGSRAWAASSPNLLNVAVSRARTKLFVIGNYEEWSGLPHFEVLAGAFRGEAFDKVVPYTPAHQASPSLLDAI